MRRTVGIVLAAIGLVGLVGWGVWSWWLPDWRPPLADGETFGIDVSRHQGVIDWSAVAEDGVEFAYIKATEGGDWLDERFAANWREAEQVGLDRGAYHFFTLCRPAVDQARWFLDTVPVDDDALPPAVDLELAGNCAARPDPSQVAAEVATFLEIVEQAWGREMVLYVGDHWETMYPTRLEFDRPIWQLTFPLRPRYDDWYIWQLHGYGHVDGMTGRVDLDIMRPPPTDAESTQAP